MPLRNGGCGRRSAMRKAWSGTACRAWFEFQLVLETALAEPDGRPRARTVTALQPFVRSFALRFVGGGVQRLQRCSDLRQ